MRIDELRPGLYVQLASHHSTDLYQVCAVFPTTATLQRLFSATRGQHGQMPARTEVGSFSAGEVARMRPAATRLVARFEEAFAATHAQVVG